MMDRIPFSAIKATVAKVLNICVSDTTRIADYVNRACQRLLEEGKWVGTLDRYRVCVTDGCVVWPRQIETIEGFAICNTPLPIRNSWYEFIGNGTYLHQDSGCTDGWGCASQLIDREDVASFSNIIGTDKQLAVYTDVQEVTGARILLQYYDTGANWVRTLDGTEWIDGEYVTFADAGSYAYASFPPMANGYIRAIKPVTKGTVRLYEYNTLDTTYRALAYYEPDETVPVYRRSLIPGLSVSESDDCQNKSITVIAKKRFIPVANDNDFLAISQPEAVRMAVQAIWKSENNLPNEAALYMYGGIDPVTRARIEGAVPILQAQLRHYRGSAPVQPMKMVNASTFGAGGIGVLR